MTQAPPSIRPALAPLARARGVAAAAALASLTSGVAAASQDLTDAPAEPLGIYGGQSVETCGWPTAVAVVGQGSLCTGTLVHPRLVVYAAHCGGDLKTIDFGELTLSPGQFVKAEECKAYPDYKGVNDQAHDWAYCRLPYSITKLPITPVLYGCETQQLQPGSQIAITGFGANMGDSGSGTKRWAMTTLNNVGSMTATLGGGGKPSVCPGDSGGPAYLQLGDGTWRAFGIASTVTGSCGGSGTHALIHKAVPWIEATSGIDITPCHDQAGNWDPDFRCAGFHTAGAKGTGTWPKWCEGTPKSGPAQTCGAPYDAVPDSSPPSVWIDDPLDGAEFEAGTAVSIAISASDGDGWGVVAVRLRINGEEQALADIDEPYGFAGVKFPAGEWTLQAVAEDAAGLLGESAPVTIVVSSPPVETTGTGGTEGDSDTAGTGAGDDSTGGEATGASTDAGTGSASAGSASAGSVSGASTLGGDEDEPEGCGCRSSGGGGAAALVVVVAAGLGRRRRAPAGG